MALPAAPGSPHRPARSPCTPSSRPAPAPAPRPPGPGRPPRGQSPDKGEQPHRVLVCKMESQRVPHRHALTVVREVSRAWRPSSWGRRCPWDRPGGAGAGGPAASAVRPRSVVTAQADGTSPPWRLERGCLGPLWAADNGSFPQSACSNKKIKKRGENSSVCA